MVETADAVDKVDAAPVIDWWHLSGGEPHLGEHLHIGERVVVSPTGGVFNPAPGLAVPVQGWTSGAPQNRRRHQQNGQVGPACHIDSGDVLGTVGGVDVASPFAGTVAGFLVSPGEKVTAGQPLAWLRAAAVVEGFD